METKLYRLILGQNIISLDKKETVMSARNARVGIYRELQWNGILTKGMVDDIIAQLIVEEVK